MTALHALLAPHVHDDEPRPRIESHGDYILGIFLLPVAVPDEDRVYYQEIDFVATHGAARSRSRRRRRASSRSTRSRRRRRAARTRTIGMFVYHLVDEIAERYLDLVDALDDEIDELEDLVADEPPREVGAAPARAAPRPARHPPHAHPDARRRPQDRRQPRSSSTTASCSRATSRSPSATPTTSCCARAKALESSRDALAGVRDYLQGKIANDQNEVMKRLTVIASLLLVPTFIVGLYGQNFRHIPELNWSFGYWWSWGLIVVTTIGQLAFFRWKRWL